jgi:hypothetical protein
VQIVAEARGHRGRDSRPRSQQAPNTIAISSPTAVTASVAMNQAHHNKYMVSGDPETPMLLPCGR